MKKRALAALFTLALSFTVAPAEAQLPGLCLPGVPLPGLECTPVPTATTPPSDTPTPGGTTTPGTTVTPGTTPTPSGTATVGPTVNPDATPVAGGSVTVVSQSDIHAIDGDVVNAGSFRIRNSSSVTETVSEIRVQVTEPAMFSSMTLTADGQSVTITDPAEENSFFFDPDVEIAPGESIDVTLSAEVGEPASSTTSSPTPEGSTTPSGTATITPLATVTPDGSAFVGFTGRGPSDPPSSPPTRPSGTTDRKPRPGPTALLAIALACLVVTMRSKRLGFVVSLLLIALYAGCGTEQTSTQTVAGITASNGSGPVTMSGLPASLGTVSRPEPLVFPGASQ